MALTELAGTDLGSQTVVIEQGPGARVRERPSRTTPTATPATARPRRSRGRSSMSFWGSMGAGGAAGLPLDKLRGPGRMILHGEQEFEVHRPPQVGETLTGTVAHRRRVREGHLVRDDGVLRARDRLA